MMMFGNMRIPNREQKSPNLLSSGRISLGETLHSVPGVTLQLRTEPEQAIMLHPNPDRQATLILSRQPSGSINASGKSAASLGYRYSGSGISEEEGVWGEWAWDGQKLVVRNDRFGFLPIYYAQLPSGFGVSTSALALIRGGAATDLDDAAVSVFVRLGYYIGNDTPFRSIQLLPAGSELTWSDGAPTIRILAPPISETVSTLSRERAVHEYGVRFQDVVEAMVPDVSERMCVPLSAGRDSRHILYALVRAGRNPSMVVTARSAPPRPSTDVEIASRITAALKLPHTIIEQSEDRFADEMQKDLLTSFCADEHAQMVPVARWLNEQKFAASWDGIAGDIFSCGVYNDNRMLDQFRKRELAKLAGWLLADDGYLRKSLTPQYRERWNRDLAVKRLSQELDQYADLPNPAAPFFFYNRVRRELALCPYGMLNQQTQILAPYLSHAIFDLLINLPFEYFKGRLFHSEAIDQFYPELPQVEYVSTSSGSVPEKRSKIWKFAKNMCSMAIHGNASQSCIRRDFLLPRLAKAMVNREFGTEVPVLFSRILVMMHLEESLALSSGI